MLVVCHCNFSQYANAVHGNETAPRQIDIELDTLFP